MNSTKIPIDELYEQLTAILQKEEYPDCVHGHRKETKICSNVGESKYMKHVMFGRNAGNEK